MTTHQLIASGSLETYLLGLSADEEQAAIDQLVTTDTELADYLHDLDADLGRYFGKQSVPPPPALRDVLELRVTDQQLQPGARHTYYDFNQRDTYQDTTRKPDYVDVEVDNTHIRVHKNWRPAFIAIFVLSKVFLIASLYFYFKADSQAQEINRLKAEIHQTTSK